MGIPTVDPRVRNQKGSGSLEGRPGGDRGDRSALGPLRETRQQILSITPSPPLRRSRSPPSRGIGLQLQKLDPGGHRKPHPLLVVDIGGHHDVNVWGDVSGRWGRVTASIDPHHSLESPAPPSLSLEVVPPALPSEKAIPSFVVQCTHRIRTRGRKGGLSPVKPVRIVAP